MRRPWKASRCHLAKLFPGSFLRAYDRADYAFSDICRAASEHTKEPAQPIYFHGGLNRTGLRVPPVDYLDNPQPPPQIELGQIAPDSDRHSHREEPHSGSSRWTFPEPAIPGDETECPSRLTPLALQGTGMANRKALAEPLREADSCVAP